MKKITNDLIYKYSFLSSIKSNEAGKKAAFMHQKANKEENKYDANLYLYQNDKVKKLTSCNSLGEFFWYDDENIVFTSDRIGEDKKSEENKKEKGKSKEEKVKLYKKNVSSISEAEFFVELEGSVSSINSLGNDHLIYLKNRDIEENDDAYFSGQQDEEGFMRVRRIPFYSNGGGFTFHKKTSLYTYDIKTGKEKEVDTGDYTIESYELSKDKTKVLIMAEKIRKRMSVYTALFEYDVRTDKISKILDDEQYSIKDPYAIYVATYFDNKPFFLGSTMEKHGLNENRIACFIEDGEVKVLNGEDVSYLNSGVQDMELAAGSNYKVFDEYIDFITTSGAINKISRLHKDGKIEEIFEYDGGISCFDYVDGKKIFVGLHSTCGQEIYLEDTKLTDFHDFLSEYYVAEPKPLSLESTGFDIDGFVLLPEDYDKKDVHPAVLEIHGGPKTAYQKTYFHEMQMLVNEGYVVFFCNPRGSAGKGNEFFDIFGLYGDVDYKNIMDFTNLVLEKYSKIDRDRLFVTGGSYGGYMTNHIVTQTDIFKAAVTQRCISNWISMYGTSDIGYYFSPDQHRTSIEDKDFWEKLWDVSPLKYVDNVKTPTMIIHSDCDYRCPLEQAYQFFTALLDRGVDSEMLVFKNEHHGLSRVGKPNNRLERLEGIRTWFEKYNK